MSKSFDPENDPSQEEALPLPKVYSWPPSHHRYDPDSRWAIYAALAARRPLLIRGEPGLGKSQLARAAAAEMNVPFVYKVVDARTECDDLMYRYDAVSRLAQAQMLGASKSGADPRTELDENRFIEPGPLWWAFNWKSASERAKTYGRGSEKPEAPEGWKPGGRCVVLIDEIDKADSDVPNGLLESLGNLGFRVPMTGETVALPETIARTESAHPLVVVTTNEERELPGAFLRRCLVLQMEFPNEKKRQIDFLISRARSHATEAEISNGVLRLAADQLLKDRADAERLGPSKPGAAEYLDVVLALVEMANGDEAEQEKKLRKIQRFAFRKNPEASFV